MWGRQPPSPLWFYVMSGDDAIRDHVFPIVEARAADPSEPRTLELASLRGTGFRIHDGTRGLTAAHVIRSPQHQLVALFVDANGWTWHRLRNVLEHEREDVATFQIDVNPRQSIFTLEATEVRSSFGCDVWGYPADVLYEVVDEGKATPRPDLVFSTGHVRRRRRPADFLPGGGGSVVAEVDFVAGGGCSGAPVIGRNQRGRQAWAVAGIYLGEQKTSDGSRRGFFLLSETFAGWDALSLTTDLT